MARKTDVTDLQTIDKQIQQLIEQRAKLELEKLIPLRRRYLELMEEISKAVAPHGLTAAKYLSMSPEQVETFIRDQAHHQATGAPPVTKRKMKVPPKYRHPQKKELTWTGRGNQPIWVREYLEGGGELDQLLINPAAAKKKPTKKRVAKKQAAKK